jgi:hypothetical protein
LYRLHIRQRSDDIDVAAASLGDNASVSAGVLDNWVVSAVLTAAAPVAFADGPEGGTGPARIIRGDPNETTWFSSVIEFAAANWASPGILIGELERVRRPRVGAS